MHIHIHVSHTLETPLEQRFTRLERMLAQLIQQGVQMKADLDALTAQVQENTDVEQSALVLIQGIAAQLEAAKTDPVAIQALADKLNTSADALAAAVAANTPAAEPPVV